MENKQGHKAVNFITHIVSGLVLAVIFGLVFGYFVMLLWNWLMPAIFGLTAVDYWQGAGLVLLTRLLFGGGHGAKRRRFDHQHGDVCRNRPNFHEWWQEEGRQLFHAYLERKGKEE